MSERWPSIQLWLFDFEWGARAQRAAPPAPPRKPIARASTSSQSSAMSRAIQIDDPSSLVVLRKYGFSSGWGARKPEGQLQPCYVAGIALVVLAPCNCLVAVAEDHTVCPTKACALLGVSCDNLGGMNVMLLLLLISSVELVDVRKGSNLVWERSNRIRLRFDVPLPLGRARSLGGGHVPLPLPLGRC